MFKLEWKLNGRTVPSNRIADELGKAIRTEAIEKMKHAVTGVRCRYTVASRATSGRAVAATGFSSSTRRAATT